MNGTITDREQRAHKPIINLVTFTCSECNHFRTWRVRAGDEMWPAFFWPRRSYWSRDREGIYCPDCTDRRRNP